MELQGAKKDGDCSKVSVIGGISRQLGCCNLYEAKNKSVTEFRCGVCEYAKAAKGRDSWLYGSYAGSMS